MPDDPNNPTPPTPPTPPPEPAKSWDDVLATLPDDAKAAHEAALAKQGETLTAMEAVIKAQVEARRKELKIPDSVVTLLDGKSPVEQLAWLNEHGTKLAASSNGLPPSPGGGGNGKATPAEILARSRRTF